MRMNIIENLESLQIWLKGLYMQSIMSQINKV